MSSTILVVSRDPKIGQPYLSEGESAFGKVGLPKTRRFFETTDEVIIECHVDAFAAWSKLREQFNIDQIVLEYPSFAAGEELPPNSELPSITKAEQVIVISPDGRDLKAHAFKKRK